VDNFNPYRPPGAQVRDPDPGFAPLPPARAVPMANALQWFQAGLQLVLRAPGAWLMIGALYFLFLILLELLPVIGPVLRCALASVIEGGMLLACMRLEATNRLAVGDALAGFRRAFQPLLMLGLISLMTLIAGALAGTAVEGASAFRRVIFGENVPIALGTIVTIDIASILAGLPLAFATALIVFHGMTPVAAVKESVRAVFRNLPALLTASAINFVLIWIALTLLGFLFIALLPWLVATSYAAYKDVFAAELKPVLT
jgi:uncharacterized membrane protein